MAEAAAARRAQPGQRCRQLARQRLGASVDTRSGFHLFAGAASLSRACTYRPAAGSTRPWLRPAADAVSDGTHGGAMRHRAAPFGRPGQVPAARPSIGSSASNTSPRRNCRGTPLSWAAASPISRRTTPWPAWCCMAEIVFERVAKDFGSGPVVARRPRSRSKEGEFCVFVGPSGCGKSTLLRMVAGLESVTAGEIRIGGKRANDVPPAKRGAALVFQSYALFPHMTIQENLAFGLKIRGAGKAETRRQGYRRRQGPGAGRPAASPSGALSGGQRQRVAIGRAMLRDPQVFLFDEPLSNLDAALRVQTRLQIAKLHRDTGRSMIYVTHDQVEAMDACRQDRAAEHRRAHRARGQPRQVGTPLGALSSSALAVRRRLHRRAEDEFHPRARGRGLLQPIGSRKPPKAPALPLRSAASRPRSEIP